MATGVTVGCGGAVADGSVGWPAPAAAVALAEAGVEAVVPGWGDGGVGATPEAAVAAGGFSACSAGLLGAAGGGVGLGADGVGCAALEAVTVPPGAGAEACK